MTYALVAPTRFNLESFARITGLHPELVRRLVALGLIEAVSGSSGALWFAPNQIAAVARIRRLRTGLSLNYAAIGLVTDLLDRIAVLEATLRSQPRRTTGDQTWT
jgi:DNA-binding transcriptional MerR regulator